MMPPMIAPVLLATERKEERNSANRYPDREAIIKVNHEHGHKTQILCRNLKLAKALSPRHREIIDLYIKIGFTFSFRVGKKMHFNEMMKTTVKSAIK